MIEWLKREAKLKQELSDLEADKLVFSPSPKGEPSVEELFTQRANREDKISEYIKEYPQLEVHRDKIRKYAHDPSRKNVPLDEVIVGAVGMKEFMKIGASLQQEANEDEKRGQMGGSNPGEVRTKTQEEAREERFKTLPKFMKGAQAAYDKL